MKISLLLKNILKLITGSTEQVFRVGVERQKNYLNKFSEPRDLIERSFFQYKCQLFFNNFLINAILNLGALILIPIFLLKGLLQKTFKDETKDAVFFRDGKPKNILPKSILEKYRNIEYSPVEKNYLSFNDLKYLVKIIKRYPISWYFILKIILKVSKYSYSIKTYSPKAIIVCAEYSFTSSILTDYCNTEKNLVHNNVMHGEKLFYIRDSFFEFNQCYVWDDYYITLFKELRCNVNQFLVEVPNSLKFTEKNIRNYEYDLIYYLAAEPEEILNRINEILLNLKNRGFNICIRIHPRYSNLALINKIFHNIHIQDSNVVPIEDSLLSTKMAVALYSTVLNQAFFNGVAVVVDDVSNPEYFELLKKLKFVALQRQHLLLSELLK